MKCPKCGNNHSKKSGQTCRCGYEFVFNPQIDHGWTDGKFLALIKRASHNGTYYFTKNQLLTYSRKSRKAASLPLAAIIIPAIIAGIFVAAFSKQPILGIIAGIVVFLVSAVCRLQTMKLSRRKLETLIDKWLNSDRKIDKLLVEPTLQTPPPEWKEKDIYDYGVEKILITQHDLQVDSLVRNNFHTEQKMLVISANGYPQYILPRLKKILTGNPAIKIYALHDTMTESEGQTFISRIRDIFECDKHEIIDLGLYQKNVELIFKALKSKPENSNEDIPLDFIPFPLLSTLLVLSMKNNAVFAYILEEAARGTYAGPDSTGSFG
jgi:hypothetical protein